jgi:hypothetical protein
MIGPGSLSTLRREQRLKQAITAVAHLMGAAHPFDIIF